LANPKARDEVRPATLEQLRTLIGRLGDRLTPRMSDAALYMLAHPNELALNPLAQVAQSSKIAAAAFIRMAQALGFAGYGDLQQLCRQPLQRAAAPSHDERIRHYGGEQPLADPNDPAEILRAFSQANSVSLAHLRDEAARLPLKRAVNLLQRAPLVHVLGLRRSFAVAAYLAYALNRVGRPAVQIIGMGGSIGEQARAVGARDLLVAISFPPYANDTLQVCEQVQRQGSRRIAITDSVLSPVARGAELVLEINDAELHGFRSLSSAMCLAQTLAMSLAFGRRRLGGDAATDAPVDLDDIDC
jgi:DNA-binding MurR/RpiR family transcriptional regulator